VLAAREGVWLFVFVEESIDCLKYVEGARRLEGTGVLGLELSGLPMPIPTFPYLLMKLSGPDVASLPVPYGAELLLCERSGV
jgi:hypothetical protein